jgi:hypothetical protein
MPVLLIRKPFLSILSTGLIRDAVRHILENSFLFLACPLSTFGAERIEINEMK